MDSLDLEDRVVRARGCVAEAICLLRDEEHPDVREVLLCLTGASSRLRLLEERHVGRPA